jgi:hypothetical protein
VGKKVRCMGAGERGTRERRDWAAAGAFSKCLVARGREEKREGGPAGVAASQREEEEGGGAGAVLSSSPRPSGASGGTVT